MQRWLLKLLLMNKAFLYQAREPSIGVKLWFLLVRALTHRRALLFGFQSSLPALPVPPLKQTVDKFLESTKQLQVMPSVRSAV